MRRSRQNKLIPPAPSTLTLKLGEGWRGDVLTKIEGRVNCTSFSKRFFQYLKYKLKKFYITNHLTLLCNADEMFISTWMTKRFKNFIQILRKRFTKEFILSKVADLRLANLLKMHFILFIFQGIRLDYK